MNGLEKEYQGELKCEILDASTPESKAQIDSYGFGTHGLVVFDGKGNLKQKIDGHKMSEKEIRSAVNMAMTGG